MTTDDDETLEERVLEAFRNDPMLAERAVDIGAIGDGDDRARRLGRRRRRGANTPSRSRAACRRRHRREPHRRSATRSDARGRACRTRCATIRAHRARRDRRSPSSATGVVELTGAVHVDRTKSPHASAGAPTSVARRRRMVASNRRRRARRRRTSATVPASPRRAGRRPQGRPRRQSARRGRPDVGSAQREPTDRA